MTAFISTHASKRCLLRNILLMLSASFVPLGCESDETEQGSLDIEIHFAAMVGGDPFKCGETYSDQGTKQTDVAFTDLRFYVYDVSLIDNNGDLIPLSLEQDEVWQQGQVALLDFEDGCENGNAALNASVRGQVPGGRYKGVMFSVGLPPDLNSPETALEGRGSPLNISAMFWSWRSGYKYLRLDTDLPSFRVHLGANECDDDFSCDESNIATFSFEGFDYQSDQISLDLQELLSDSDLTQNAEGTAPGCMGQGDDPDCQYIYDHFNLGEGDTSAFTVTPRSP